MLAWEHAGLLVASAAAPEGHLHPLTRCCVVACLCAVCLSVFPQGPQKRAEYGIKDSVAHLFLVCTAYGPTCLSLSVCLSVSVSVCLSLLFYVTSGAGEAC